MILLVCFYVPFFCQVRILFFPCSYKILSFHHSYINKVRTLELILSYHSNAQLNNLYKGCLLLKKTFRIENNNILSKASY